MSIPLALFVSLNCQLGREFQVLNFVRVVHDSDVAHDTLFTNSKQYAIVDYECLGPWDLGTASNISCYRSYSMVKISQSSINNNTGALFAIKNVKTLSIDSRNFETPLLYKTHQNSLIISTLVTIDHT